MNGLQKMLLKNLTREELIALLRHIRQQDPGLFEQFSGSELLATVESD